jgi:hypothetical protein
MKNNYFIGIMYIMVKSYTRRKHKPTMKKMLIDDAKIIAAKKKAISTQLKSEMDDLSGLFGSVSVGAKSANRQLASGVNAVETGVGTLARGANRGLVSGVNAAETGITAVAREAKNEIDDLTGLFSKQKFGGVRRTRTKRRRHKKRARSTKKR